jgi:hypothetical protein
MKRATRRARRRGGGAERRRWWWMRTLTRLGDGALDGVNVEA